MTPVIVCVYRLMALYIPAWVRNTIFHCAPLLRAGASDEELEQAIRTAINMKPEKHEFNEHPEKVLRFMSYTGG